MSKSDHHYHGGKAVAWLATSVVLLLGVGTCTFIILVFSESPVPFLLATAGGILGFFALLWLLGDKQPRDLMQQRYGWLKGTGSYSKSVRYRFGRKNRAECESDPDAIQPPTADTIRRIRDESGLTTWVPSDHRRLRSPFDD